MNKICVTPALAVVIVALNTGSTGSAQGPPGSFPAVTEELIGEKDATAPEHDDEDVVSADGRHAAWRTGRERKWGVMLDGQRQAGEYEEVKALAFGGGGQHLAFAARRGTAWMMVLDAREGAPFDEIGSAVFSADGARTAYAAKRDKKWFVVVDGIVPEASYDKVGPPVFSQDAKRLAFPAKRGKWILVADGKELEGQFDDVDTITFSPDGLRLAWVGRRGSKRVVALDGKEGAPFDTVGGLTFSADSRRFAHVGADIQGGFKGNKGKGRAVIDGEPGPQFEGTQLPLSNSEALDPTASSDLATYLVTRGKLDPVYGSHLLYWFHGVSRPVFSADGSRVAYAARRGKNDETVFMDGQPGIPFPSVVGLPAFSGDGAHVAFAVSAADVTKLLVDGGPVGTGCCAGTDFVTAITFAPDGRRVAYVGVAGGHMHKIGMSPRAKRCVYVDGQPGVQYDALAVSALQFSPDSRHFVYVVHGVQEGSRQVSFVVANRTEAKRYDAVWTRTLGVQDTGAVVYVAQSGRKFLRVTHPIQ